MKGATHNEKTTENCHSTLEVFVNKQAEARENDFLDKILSAIVDDGRMTPKFQVERAISPFIGVYLKEVLSTLRNGNKIEVLSAEFPLKKLGSRQSTNADWLAYDEKDKKFLLIELKTEDSSFRLSQHDIYQNITERPLSWRGIISGIKEIAEGSIRKDKYNALIKRLEDAEIRLCETDQEKNTPLPVEVIYLVPSPIPEVNGIKCFNFNAILDSIRKSETTRSNQDLIKIFNKMTNLSNAAPSEDGGDLCPAPLIGSKNYQGKRDLREILKMVAEDKPIRVGFDGGESAMRKSSWDYLSDRIFKWDHKDAVQGKNIKNWIDGETFLKVIDEIRPKPHEYAERRDALEKVAAIVEGISNPDSRLWLVRELARRFDIRDLEGD